ncbi:MAG: hypothetical protein ABIW81_02385 [Terrimesophilobacter sp.]
MSHPTDLRENTKWGHAIGIAIAASVAVAIILLAFLWPAITSTLKDFPLAVTGDADHVAALTTALEQNASGRFAITEVKDRAAAVDAIEKRNAYGAVVLGSEPEVLTASAGGAAQTQVMGQLGGQVQQQVSAAAGKAIQGDVAKAIAAAQSGAIPQEQLVQALQQALTASPPTVKTTDVVPLASTDATGVGFMAAGFPAVIGGVLGGVLISLIVVGAWRRFAAVIAFSIIAGVGVAAITQAWLGILQGSFVLNVAAISLSLLATGSFITGMSALLGRAGTGIGAVLTILVANPISSAVQPMQFLPWAWGAIGQYFVPGATTTLQRDISYFPQADQMFPWLVLGAWALVGLVLGFVGHNRNRNISAGDRILEERSTDISAAVAQ